jgi:hypothetical protein
VPARLSATERIRSEIDELFASQQDLGQVLEQVARLRRQSAGAPGPGGGQQRRPDRLHPVGPPGQDGCGQQHMGGAAAGAAGSPRPRPGPLSTRMAGRPRPGVVPRPRPAPTARAGQPAGGQLALGLSLGEHHHHRSLLACGQAPTAAVAPGRGN